MKETKETKKRTTKKVDKTVEEIKEEVVKDLKEVENEVRKTKRRTARKLVKTELDSENINDAVEDDNMDLITDKIKILTTNMYDIQKLRIAAGNRIVQSFNIQMGQAPSTKQKDMEEEAQKVIQVLRKEYNRITDAYLDKSYIVSIKKGKSVEEKVVSIGKNAGIEKVIKQMSADVDADITFIKSKIDYELMSTYMSLLETEHTMNRLLSKEVEKHPMWDAFFKDVVGCGHLMTAVCLSYLNIHEARHMSSFLKYAGLDTVEVERPKIIGWSENKKPIFSDTETEKVREGRAKWHTEMVEYTDKDGNIKEKRSITYNEQLRTRLLGVLGPSFIKKPGCKYEQIYRDFRFRLDNRADSDKLTDLHKHRMAIRYMIKQFLRDMWVTWRALAGYEVSEPYEVAFLGRKPHKYNEYHARMAEETRRK